VKGRIGGLWWNDFERDGWEGNTPEKEGEALVNNSSPAFLKL